MKSIEHLHNAISGIFHSGFTKDDELAKLRQLAVNKTELPKAEYKELKALIRQIERDTIDRQAMAFTHLWVEMINAADKAEQARLATRNAMQSLKSYPEVHSIIDLALQSIEATGDALRRTADKAKHNPLELLPVQSEGDFDADIPF